MTFKADLDTFTQVTVAKLHRANLASIEDYVYNFIVSTSPVDEGAYRANHHRTEGSPDASFDINKKSGKEPSPVGESGFKVFFVTNGAPYAQALENGHSDQGKHIYAAAYQAAKAKYQL